MELLSKLNLMALLLYLYSTIMVDIVSSCNCKEAPGDRKTAYVDIHGAEGWKVHGRLTIVIEEGVFHVTGELRGQGLKPGLHGFHVHDKPTMTTDCSDVGLHLNPYNAVHGSSSYGHLGDMSNIEASTGDNGEGWSKIDIRTNKLSLNNGEANSVINKSLVFHQQEDDYNSRNDPQGKINGNSGLKIACGNVIITHEGA